MASTLEQKRAAKLRRLAKNENHGTVKMYTDGCRCDPCRKARADYMQERRTLKPEAFEEENRKTRERRAAEREVIQQIKLEAGCADCGYNTHPAGLTFDHVRGVKLFTISNACGSYPLEKVLAEIEKCEVVCATCHAVRTFERGQHRNDYGS